MMTPAPGPVCKQCDLPVSAVDEQGLCFKCSIAFAKASTQQREQCEERLKHESAGEAAQRYERRLRDDVLDQFVEWLAEEDRDTVPVRDVLEFIHTLRTRKP